MMPSSPATRSRVTLHGGDLWVGVSAMARGQTVEILHVSDQHVYFRHYGRRADSSHKFKLLRDAFRVSYAPLRLSRKLKSDGAAVLTPSSPGRPSPREIAPEEVPEEEPMMPTFAEIPSPDLPPIVVQSYEELRPPRKGNAGRVSRFTVEQIREVFLLYKQGGKPSEIGPIYNMAPSTVNNVGAGRDYAWATADLRGEGPPVVLATPEPTPESLGEPLAAVPPPAPITEEEPPMVSAAPPPTVETVEPQPAPTPARVVVPTESLQSLAAQRSLLADLTEALETLIDLHGKPTRRFLSVDIAAMRVLVMDAKETLRA